jgi:hypothetical protein
MNRHRNIAAHHRVVRRNVAKVAGAASAAARAARAAAAAPDLLPGAMDVDVDVPSDVDSVPSVPAAADDFLAQLGPRRLPLRGAAREQPLGAPPGARPAPPAPAPRHSERVIVPSVLSSSEEEDSGAYPSSEDGGTFVAAAQAPARGQGPAKGAGGRKRRRKRQRVGKGPLRERAGASARARTRRERSRCRRPSRPSKTAASARRARKAAARCCGLARARYAAARARTSCSACSCILTGWISSR